MGWRCLPDPGPVSRRGKDVRSLCPTVLDSFGRRLPAAMSKLRSEEEVLGRTRPALILGVHVTCMARFYQASASEAHISRRSSLRTCVSDRSSRPVGQVRVGGIRRAAGIPTKPRLSSMCRVPSSASHDVDTLMATMCRWCSGVAMSTQIAWQCRRS
jgi:hypothetical protein